MASHWHRRSQSDATYHLSSHAPTTTAESHGPADLGRPVPGKRLFDYKLCKKHYGGKAVILHIDNSVSTLPVDKSGHVYLNGKDLFDPSQPFWHGKAPDVKWPE